MTVWTDTAEACKDVTVKDFLLACPRVALCADDGAREFLSVGAVELQFVDVAMGTHRSDVAEVTISALVSDRNLIPVAIGQALKLIEGLRIGEVGKVRPLETSA